MAQVRLSGHAVADLRRLDAFLREKNVEAANRTSLLLDAALVKLMKHPRLGPPLSGEAGLRQLFIGFGGGGYVIRYRLAADDSVLVIRVKHARERR